MSKTCPTFWLENPQILWAQATEFFPFTEHDKRCTASALNSFTRFGIYLGLVLAVIRLQPAWLLVGVVFAAFTVAAWFYMDKHGSVREGFEDELENPFETDAPIIDPREVDGRHVPDVIGLEGRTGPTAANPFMNVLISEISDNPYRQPAGSVTSPDVKRELDNYFQTMFANDPGDVFQRTQNQRVWVAMPSTTIPNDQGAFADWLYRTPGQTCKEGNTAVCDFNSGAETLPWREMRRLT